MTFEMSRLIANDISDKHLIVRCDENILWLDVPVYHVFLMQLFHSRRTLLLHLLSRRHIQLD